jgi:hypothetical protein
MEPIDITEYNSKAIYNSLPVTSENATWNACVLTEEQFKANEATIALLKNVTLYKGDGIIISATFESLIANKNYVRQCTIDRDSIILYHYLYVYTS